MRASCIKYGDDISTDLIIAGKYTKTLDLRDLARHCMEDLDEDFHQKVEEEGRKILVAGNYFGCGSSREQAPVAIRESGIRLVVARTFSRIFYRNAVNVGIPIVECDTDRIDDGDELAYELGDPVLQNLTKGEAYPVAPMPAVMVEIMLDGGIAAHFAKKGGF